MIRGLRWEEREGRRGCCQCQIVEGWITVLVSQCALPAHPLAWCCVTHVILFHILPPPLPWPLQDASGRLYYVAQARLDVVEALRAAGEAGGGAVVSTSPN